ncbi:LysR family transcriptional regulator [Paenibacillus shunpengii]|uniref:LysR family transcriptional regulator n=1 Tax=Paenibacillus shunpengii TaxID=2054424 RepID=A0ABW5SRC0_9BACL|nr:LysR family transcriptional regulator [Paenibacillus sp. PDC88]SDX22143.1 DNA-binding transcriptional regulator, LysR family [Paenibacillus sp. PDC88]
MNLIKFQILVLIDKWNKVTDVAKELDMKQPTVSFHMKSLEKDMGTALFISARGRIMLTEAGKAILPYAKQMINLDQTARRTAQLFTELNQGSLQIKSDPLVSSYYLSSLIAEFADQYPGIRISNRLFDEVSDPGSEENFIAARLDKLGSPLEESSDKVLIQTDELILLVPENHPFTQEPDLHPGELSKYMFVNYESCGWISERMERFTQITGAHLWERVYAATPEAAVNMVAAGKAITFFPASAVRSADSRVAKLPIPGLSKEDVMMCVTLSKMNELTPAGQQFWSFLSHDHRNPEAP